MRQRDFHHVKNGSRKKLDSPAARAKLKASGKPYWRSIDPCLHLGYRKGLAGGKWVVRRYLGNEKYAVETIAAADDHSPADGDVILDFFHAQRCARDVAAKAKAPATSQGPLTVSAAMDAYFARLENEEANPSPMRAAGQSFISYPNSAILRPRI